MPDDRVLKAMEDVINAAREIADSFTDSAGEFIHDDLTETEWTPLRFALDYLDAMKGSAPEKVNA